MADEKEFENLTSAAGIKCGRVKDPYKKICGLLGIAFAAKDSVATMRNAIIASNAANLTRDFAEILKKMSVDEPKPRAVKKSAPVVVHVDVKVADEEKKTVESIVYPLCDASFLNREALSEQIHAIHNFLRNRGVGYGMSALKRFNLFYGLARIEQFNLFSVVGLDVSCKFSELLKLAQRCRVGGESDPSNPIFDLVDQYLDEMNKNPMIKKFIMSELPRGIQEDTLAQLILNIDQLLRSETQIGEQICGKVYEYFIGRDQTAISELGAYFTNRSITQFVYDQLAPELDADGKVQSMIDPFGGSGGFTTGYVMDLNKRFESIDWKDGISRVYHFDMNNDVVRYAALELMCLTRALPNMSDNMICENSFATERFAQYKYVCTNPPYGGDNIGESASQKTRKLLKEKLTTEIALLKAGGTINADTLKKRELQIAKINKEIQADDIENDKQKVKTGSLSTSQFIKNYARKNGLFASESRPNHEVLFGNDKEATSLILIAALVAPGGTAVGVLKEGVFFDAKYTALRKHLIEKFNVRKVISVPKDQFENTSTKTSIIIFDNDPVKKTSRIEFSELKVTTYDQNEFGEDSSGNLVVIGIKGAFREVNEHPLSSASINDLQQIIISKSKTEKEKQTQPWSLLGRTYSLRVALPGPGYKMVKIDDICEFLPKSKRAASFGQSEGKYSFYSSSTTVRCCDIADQTVEAIIIGTGGNSCLHLAREYSCSADTIQLIAKPLCDQKYIYYSLLALWESFLLGMNGSTIKHVNIPMVKTFQLPFPVDNTKMNEWVTKISTVYDERLAIEAKIADTKSYISTEIKRIVNGECSDSSFAELSTFTKKTKSYRAADCNLVGKYRFYSSSQSMVRYRDDFEFPNLSIIIGRGGNPSIHIDQQFAISRDDIHVIECIDPSMIAYIYSYILSNMQLLEAGFVGSVIKHISKEYINKINVKIPTDRAQIAIIAGLHDQLKEHQQRFQSTDIEYKKLIAELTREAILPDLPIESRPISDVPNI